MKRLLCVLALLALFSCSFAEEIDLSGLTYNELRDLRDRVEQAMSEFGLPQPGEVIFENNAVRLTYISSETEHTTYGYSRISVTVEWTNLSNEVTSLAMQISADAWIDGVYESPYSAEKSTRIRPGVTHAVEYIFSVDDGAKVAEFAFGDRQRNDTAVRTLTYYME